MPDITFNCDYCTSRFTPTRTQKGNKKRGHFVFCCEECSSKHDWKIQRQRKGKPKRPPEMCYGRPGEKSIHSYKYLDAAHNV